MSASKRAYLASRAAIRSRCMGFSLFLYEGKKESVNTVRLRAHVAGHTWACQLKNSATCVALS